MAIFCQFHHIMGLKQIGFCKLQCSKSWWKYGQVKGGWLISFSCFCPYFFTEGWWVVRTIEIRSRFISSPYFLEVCTICGNFGLFLWQLLAVLGIGRPVSGLVLRPVTAVTWKVWLEQNSAAGQAQYGCSIHTHTRTHTHIHTHTHTHKHTCTRTRSNTHRYRRTTLHNLPCFTLLQ